MLIYIDPPYNTGRKDEFVYEDSYSSSASWLTMMEDRLSLCRIALLGHWRRLQ